MIKNYSPIINHRALKVLGRIKAQSIMVAAFILLYVTQVAGQPQPKDIIEKQFDTYRQNSLEEKIFVHTDKNIYLPGEICWFKIYNVDAYFHKPINLGKVAYVEILDNNNKAVLQAKIALDNGAGDGSFFLPATLMSGNYRLRAYTNWMKNYGADYFFEKKLSIINVQNNGQENTVAPKPAYDIAFFPEGGNLVNGINCKVGFRIINQFGKGVYGDGDLLNEKGESVTKFHPLKFGIGNFSI
ncbi:MAG: MG2 domain-containing protein, partial [Ferruginibacter sp.]